MKSAPFARLVSLLCVSFGALMLVAPDQFGAPQYVMVQPHVDLWGAAFLSAGAALLVATVLDVRGWLRSCLLVLAGGVLIAVGVGFGLAGAWTEVALYSTVGLAAFLVAATPRRSGGTGGRRELLEVVVSASTVILGVIVLLSDPAGAQPAGLLGAQERWYGAVLAASGGLLLVSQVRAAPSTALVRVGRLSTALGLIVYVAVSSLPQHIWTNALLFAGFGLALAVQPRIDPRYHHFDATSLRLRLVLVLAATATLPLVALFVIDAKREEVEVARLTLTLNQSLAEALARDVLREVTSYEAEAKAVAALPDLVSMPADHQAEILRTFKPNPPVQVLATFDSTGQALARSDDRPLVDLRGTPLYEDVHGAVARTVDRATYGQAGTVTLQIAAPIRSVDGQLLGALLIETEQLTNSLLSVDPGTGGHIYLAGSSGVTDGAAMVSPNPLAASTPLGPPHLQEVVDGPTSSGSLTYTGGGQNWLAGFARVPNIGRVIVVERLAALALAPVRGGREALLGLLLACGLLAIAAGVLVAGQLDQPLKILAAAASHFGDSDLADPLPRSRIAEVALLAGNFGAMRDTLVRRTADLKQAEADARRAEAELRQLNLVLEQRVVERTTALELASKRKSDFLTSMSHELRTPLNAIIGFSEIMLDHDVTEIPDDQRNTFLAHIQRGGHHLLGLVNDILDLAKVEAGRMELSLERVPLREVMVGCVEVIRGMSDPKLLTLVTHCEPADAVVTADPVRLKQILYNLLSNAVKFTPTGGHISLSAQVDSTGAVIAVRDSGIGIRTEDKGLIFEPFRQAKAFVPPRQEGTGLGLPLVRELVELHGGRVWLDSAPGTGSCFTFTLPNAVDLGETAKPEALALAS